MDSSSHLSGVGVCIRLTNIWAYLAAAPGRLPPLCEKECPDMPLALSIALEIVFNLKVCLNYGSTVDLLSPHCNSVILALNRTGAKES